MREREREREMDRQTDRQKKRAIEGEREVLYILCVCLGCLCSYCMFLLAAKVYWKSRIIAFPGPEIINFFHAQLS